MSSMIEGWIVATCIVAGVSVWSACGPELVVWGGSYNCVICGVEQDTGDDRSDGETPSEAMDAARRRRRLSLLFLRDWGIGALASLAGGAVHVSGRLIVLEGG